MTRWKTVIRHEILAWWATLCGIEETHTKWGRAHCVSALRGLGQRYVRRRPPATVRQHRAVSCATPQARAVRAGTSPQRDLFQVKS